MKASRNILIPLICILAMVSAAGAVELAATGTNSVVGTATAQGDIFTLQPDTAATAALYSGLWAHAYVPAGAAGTNSADSERTVPARTETRTFTSTLLGNKNYDLMNTYGDSTLIAKASKAGVLGTAEAFSEVSSQSEAVDIAGTGPTGEVHGGSQLVAYVQHSGTGAANASATGSATYQSLLSTGEIYATGSVDGSAALSAANNYGGAVTGAAWKSSDSGAFSNSPGSEWTASVSFEYLYLTSGRNALSAQSEINGSVAGDASASGFYALAQPAGTPGRFGNAESSSTGDVSGSAVTYKLGDNIAPGHLAIGPIVMFGSTQLDNAANKGITGTLWDNYGPQATGKASAYLLSQGAVFTSNGKYHTSMVDTESLTSAVVTRTLADASQTYGASYIDNGALSASADTASAPGGSPITIASAGADAIFMGSGAHLVSRLTGANPASAADLTISASETAIAGEAPISYGFVTVSGTAGAANRIVRAVGPIYSPTGTSADATGSYLTALNIDGTAVHTLDNTGTGFTSSSTLVADDIDEINIWSWIAGDDPRSHAESAHGITPFVSQPVYTSSPVTLASGVTSGPIAAGSADTTSRSIDTIFSSSIRYPNTA